MVDDNAPQTPQTGSRIKRMEIKQIISELKRRRVIKAGIAYLVFAWLIVQVAAIILPAFHAPASYLQTLLIIMAVFFPLFLVLSWIYEWNAGRIRKTVRKSDDTTPISARSTKLNKIIIAALSVIVILLIVKILLNPQGSESINSQEILTPDSNKNQTGAIDLLAVLPFANNKPDIETDFLGFAIADQIIGDLAYLMNITVRPSGSVRKYENTTFDPAVVGNELNVDYLLMGSYLKQDDMIKLNVELINIKTNEMIWREPIAVAYSNVFELQEIVAEKVVEGLDVKITQKELNRARKDIPNDPLAYEYYLKSISYPFTNEGDKLAIAMLEKSMDIDSLFAPTYNELGLRTKRLAQFGLLDPQETTKAEEYFLKSLDLNEELMSALANLSILYTESARTLEAARLAKQMLRINHNNAQAHYSLGYIYRYVGMLDASIDEMEIAVALDPKNRGFRSLGVTYFNNGEYEKAFRALDIDKGSSYNLGWKGNIYFQQGRFDEAMVYYDSILAIEPEGLWSYVAKTLLAYIDDEPEKGLIALNILEEANVVDAEAWYYWASFYGLYGNVEGCKRGLERAINGGYFNYPFMITDKNLEPVRKNPQIKKILDTAKEKHQSFKDQFSTL